jgi:cytoskeletal protein CcmA (bactofilin family)
MSVQRTSGASTPNEDSLSIIGSGLHVVGEMATEGIVKIEGSINGSVRATRQVLVTRGGVVQGDIYTTEAIIGGEVRGSIYADDRIEVQDSSVIHGDIVTKRLMVQEGGEVNGHIRMGEPRALELGAKVAAQEPVAVLEREAL